MISLTDIDSFWDVLGILVVTLGTVGVAAVPVLLLRQHRHNQETISKLDAVKGQVVNGHADAPPLRADIDQVLEKLDRMKLKVDGIDSMVRVQGRDIGGIREDVGLIRGEARDDRKNLSDLEKRIQGFVRREHPGADPL